MAIVEQARPEARTIVEAELVTARVKRLQADCSNFDEVWDGLYWRLARDPFVGATRVPDTKPILYLVKTPPWRPGGVPVLRLAYRVTQTEVIIERLATQDEH